MPDEEEQDRAQDNRETLNSLRNALSSAQLSFETLVEIDKVHAKRLRAKYEAYVDAGFNESEAFHLINHRGLN